MQIKGKNIILRDFVEADIEKRIYWETVETEWQQWDAPWEYENLSEEEKKEELEHYVASVKQWVEQDKMLVEEEMQYENGANGGVLKTDEVQRKEKVRYRFQIVINNDSKDYIGWCTAYCIDEDYSYTDEEGFLAVGINIPEVSMRGKGYATEALCMFIVYLLEHGQQPLFTQTWSGNERMIHVAEKIGFKECRRKKDLRKVRGQNYDGLTFKLDEEYFWQFMEMNYSC